MRVGILFSGGKDSVLALDISKKEGHKVSCLINLVSENKYSYMFHTPSVNNAIKQAKALRIPIISHKTLGEKEEELSDLKSILEKAKKKYNLDGIVSGAVKSVYQASRIQKICKELGLELLNPLWQMDELKILELLIERRYDVRIVGVFAYPLTKDFLGRKIDEAFVKEACLLKEKYKINPAGEGGEFETFVLDCDLFKKKLKITGYSDFEEGENSFRRELKIEVEDENNSR